MWPRALALLLLSRLGYTPQPIRAFISFMNSHLILLLLDLRLEDGDETVVIVQLFLQREEGSGLRVCSSSCSPFE